MENDIEFMLRLRDEMLTALYSLEQRLQQAQKQKQTEPAQFAGLLGGLNDDRQF